MTTLALLDPADIRQIRRNLGLTQEKLGNLANISREEICRLENFKSRPTPRVLRRITLALASNGHKRLTEVYRYRDAKTDQIIDLEILESMDLIGKNGKHYTYKQFEGGYLIITRGY